MPQPERRAAVGTVTGVRRPPPPFRVARVEDWIERSARLTRVELGGPDLVGLRVEMPAASVRLLLPEPSGLVLPEWSGNEFLLPDGRRPTIRTLTPLDADAERGRLAVEIVRHGRGALDDWLTTLRPGGPVAVSGPGRGYVVGEAAEGFLLAGDEAALPAIGQLASVVGSRAKTRILVELADASGRLDLGSPAEFVERRPTARPGSALVAALGAVDLPAGWHVWVAGEAAAVQRIRRILFDEHGVGRDRVAAHGYWQLKDSSGAPESHRMYPGSPGMLGEE